jgi:hypothetical protein
MHEATINAAKTRLAALFKAEQKILSAKAFLDSGTLLEFEDESVPMPGALKTKLRGAIGRIANRIIADADALLATIEATPNDADLAQLASVAEEPTRALTYHQEAWRSLVALWETSVRRQGDGSYELVLSEGQAAQVRRLLTTQAESAKRLARLVKGEL